MSYGLHLKVCERDLTWCLSGQPATDNCALQNLIITSRKLQTVWFATEIQDEKNLFPQYSFSICLQMNINPNAMKQEYVFSRDEDMTKADIYFRPQDGMILYEL